MAKSALTDLLERLEMRRMTVAEYRVIWCSSCLRCSLRIPKVKDSYFLLHSGDEECRQLTQEGTISECIASLSEFAAPSEQKE